MKKLKLKKINFKKIKLEKDFVKRISVVVLVGLVLVLSLFALNNTLSEFVAGSGSRVENGVAYIDDRSSDYYYLLGMNYVRTIDNRTVQYKDSNLVPLIVNYYGYSKNTSPNCSTGNNFNSCGYVSYDDRIYKYTYYKYAPIENGKINLDLIDNPFTLRPTDKGFNGWETNNGTISTNSSDHTQSLSLNVSNNSTLTIDIYAKWADANVIYLDGVNGDDLAANGFDGSLEFPAGSWQRAMQLLKTQGQTKGISANDRELNIIVLKDDVTVSFNYTRPLTHNNIRFTDNYNESQTFVSGQDYIIEFPNGDTKRALRATGTGATNITNYVLPTDEAIPDLSGCYWTITATDEGYTIKNVTHNRYLSYESIVNQTTMGLELRLSTTPTTWKYDQTRRMFYVHEHLEREAYTYTEHNNFTNNESYYLTSNVNGNLYMMRGAANNGTPSSQAVNRSVLSDNNLKHTMIDNGNTARIRSTQSNAYLVPNQTGTGLTYTTQMNRVDWTYDRANQSFYQNIQVTAQVPAFESSVNFNTGNFYITTSNDANSQMAIGSATQSTTLKEITLDNQDTNYLATIAQAYNNRGVAQTGYTIKFGNYYLYASRSGWFNNYTYSLSYNTSGTSTNVRWTYNAGTWTSVAYPNYYLYVQNNTLMFGNQQGRFYLTTVGTRTDITNKNMYISYNREDSNWTLKDAQDETTRIGFTTAEYDPDVVDSDFRLRFNNNNWLIDQTGSQLTYITGYTVTKDMGTGTYGTVDTNSQYTTSSNIAFTLTSQYNGVNYKNRSGTNGATWNLAYSTTDDREHVVAHNDLQIENVDIHGSGDYDQIYTDTNIYANQKSNGSFLIGNWFNVRLGIGLKPVDTPEGVTFLVAQGGASYAFESRNFGSSTNTSGRFKFVVESGRYSSMWAVRGGVDGYYNSNALNMYGTMNFVGGNDLDRIKKNDTNLQNYHMLASSNSSGRIGPYSDSTPAFVMTIKSGDFGYDFFKDDLEEYTYGIYVGGLTVSASDTNTESGSRILIIEGGKVGSIQGGLRMYSSQNKNTKIYVKGGTISNIVGGAGRSETYGDRYISVTNGVIDYSISGGSNGETAGSGEGTLSGDTYVHVGGKAEIGASRSGSLFGVNYGSVLGAGNGNSNVSASGSAEVTHVYISDECTIRGSVYGGGNYGNVVNSVNLQIDGGTIEGSVYGGPNQNKVGNSSSDPSKSIQPSNHFIDSQTFTSGEHYIIDYVSGSSRNALTNQNGANISNTSLNTNSTLNNSLQWTIAQSGAGYTIRNRQTNNYLTNSGTDLSASGTQTVWNYDSSVKSFYKSITSQATSTYSAAARSFNTSDWHVITNNNQNAILRVDNAGNNVQTLTGWSTNTALTDQMMWKFIPTGTNNEYYIYNKGAEKYLSSNTNATTNTLTLSSTPQGWIYTSTYGQLYFRSGNSYMYLYFNSNTFSGYKRNNTTTNSAYRVYYRAAYRTEAGTLDYYINYNNGWELTSNRNIVNPLVFTTNESSDKLTINSGTTTNGNVNITMTNGTIKNGLYGGSCIKGYIAGNVTININGGNIEELEQHGGAVFGGGYGEPTYVLGNITLNIKDTANSVKDVKIDGDVYGGSALGSVKGKIDVNIEDSETYSYKIKILGDMFGGSMGDDGDSLTGGIMGDCTIKVSGGTYTSSVYGGNNQNSSTQGNITVTIDGTNNYTNVKNVFGGGNEADSYANTVKVYTKGTTTKTIIDNLYGGGNEAFVEETEVHLIGGSINNAFGGGNSAAVTNSHIKLEGATVSNLYGGSNVTGDLTSSNVEITSGNATNVYGGNNKGGSVTTTNVKMNGGTLGLVFGGGNEADVVTTNVIVNSPTVVTTLYGGGNNAEAVTTNVTINSGSVTTAFGGGNNGEVTTSNIEVKGSTGTITNVYGGGNLASVSTSNTNLIGGTITNAFGGGNQAGISTKANITLKGSTCTNVYGGSNQSGEVSESKVLIESGSSENVFGSNNAGGNTVIPYVEAKGGTVGTIYGGGNEAPSGNTTVFVYSNATATNVYGGGKGSSAIANDTSVTISSAANVTNVYGGGDNGTAVNTSVTINGTGSTIDYVFGGGNNADCVSSNVILLGGTINNAFGGGNSAAVSDSIVINAKGSSIISGLYGGSNNTGDNDDATVNVESGVIATVYGGNNIGGTTVDTTVNIKGGTITTVYGGGNQANTKTTDINVIGGTITDLYGGGNLAPVEKTNVVVESQSSNRITNLYGGGNQATADDTNVLLKSGTIVTVYAGGNAAGITNETNVELNGATTSNIYGGSNSSGNVPVTNVVITSGTVSQCVYGGNNLGGLTDISNVTVNGCTKVGTVYGGGNIATTNTPHVKINGGNSIGTVYGGGNAAEITNNTDVKIIGGNITGNVFGGGNNGEVAGTSIIDIRGGTIGGSAHAGGNGSTAIVNNATVINVHGNATINGNVFGGGNAADTGVEGESLTGTVNIAGGNIGGNVYGGANTAVLYGNTVVNIGYTPCTGIRENQTPVGVNSDPSTNTYDNSYGEVEIDSNLLESSGTYTSNILSFTNLTDHSISDWTIVLDIGDNTLDALYNADYEIRDGYVYITSNTALISSIQSGNNVVLNGQMTLTNPSDIRVVAIYENPISNPYFGGVSELIKGDIHIAGTVFGGGEANASGSEEYDYSFISVTEGIVVNIDGQGHDHIDIDGSIFGSGNASSSAGESYIYIRNYGTPDDIKSNISLQRADLCIIENSHAEFTGASDRTNEYSNEPFSLSRIKHLKLKNNSSIYCKNTPNLLEKFDSLVDINGEEVKAAVTIDPDTGEILSRNVNNRLYIYEGNNINICTNENLSAYGVVNGMSFFGMYTHVQGSGIETAMYTDGYEQGDDVLTNGDGSHFTDGSYVLGLHKADHNIEVDGFYTNTVDTVIDDDNRVQSMTIQVGYINPTPDDAAFYRWLVGTPPEKYQVTLTASRFSTLGSAEVQFTNYTKPNTTFQITGFNYSDLDSEAQLVSSNLIPRINKEGTSNTKMGLTLKTNSGSGWITIGETKFFNNSIWMTGTDTYLKENSNQTPSLSLFINHSKNISRAGDLGKVIISIMTVTPVDDLHNEVKLINLEVTINREVYPTVQYEGAMMPDRQYELFASTPTNITNSSSLSAYFSTYISCEDVHMDDPNYEEICSIDNVENIYSRNNYRVLTSNWALPVGTKITMIDLAAGNTPEYYYYVINQQDYNFAVSDLEFNAETGYRLDKFIKMGSDTVANRYDENVQNALYYDGEENAAVEEFVFIVDFKDANIDETISDCQLLIETRDQNDASLYTVLGVQQANCKYNLYEGKDATINVTASLSNDSIYVGDTTTLTVNTDFQQFKTNDSNTIFDTNFSENKLGIKITLVDSYGNQLEGADLMGVSFRLGSKTYYARSDGTVRINLAERVANVSSKIVINTENSSLAGNYTIKVESFYSADGIYYGLESNNYNEVTLKVLRKSYGLKIIAENEYLVIDKNTGYNLSSSMNYINKFRFTISHASQVENPSLKIALYRRDYSTVGSTNYSIVDMSTLFNVNGYDKYNTTEIRNFINSLGTNSTLYLDIVDPKTLDSGHLRSGTYKFECRLYDGNNYIGEVHKYIIVR